MTFAEEQALAATIGERADAALAESEGLRAVRGTSGQRVSVARL